MAKARSDLTWTEIDPASLPAHVAKQYEAYKTSYRAMKAEREAFEALVNKGAPKGKRIVCGYNFGKLSLALADQESKPERKAQGSLADFLQAQHANGRSV